jgi:hypothetical protein
MMTKLTRILSLTLLTTSLSHAAWDKNDDSLAYQLDGKDVWRLNYSQTKDSKPHFSALHGLSKKLPEKKHLRNCLNAYFSG